MLFSAFQHVLNAPQACFSEITAMRYCCSGRDPEVCFVHGRSFETCCPPEVVSKPCFGDILHHQLCCFGDEWPECNYVALGHHGCCGSWWAEPVPGDPLIHAIRDAREFGTERQWSHRGAFFAELVFHRGVQGPFVELGVWRGEFAATFLQNLRRLAGPGNRLTPMYFMVDLWRQEYADHNPELGNASDNMRKTIERVARFAPHTALLQLSTTHAARHFANDSLSFVYIDADHEYDSVLGELDAYWPKVHAGGVIAGDDYNYPPCMVAVNHFALSKGAVLQMVHSKWFRGPASRHQWWMVKRTPLT